jgi:hypothetical protein
LPLATRLAICKPGITDPCILGKPFVFLSAMRAERSAEKHRRGMKGCAVNSDTGRNSSSCLGATDHDDTHVTFLLFRRRASGTALVRTTDETTVVISRHYWGARKIVAKATNRGRYARYCDVEVATLVVPDDAAGSDPARASMITVRVDAAVFSSIVGCLSVPNISSALISRRNRIPSEGNVRHALFRPGRFGLAIQVEEPA